MASAGHVFVQFPHPVHSSSSIRLNPSVTWATPFYMQSNPNTAAGL
jgi:hypothetical protein